MFFLSGVPITQRQILLAREKRAAFQRKMLKDCNTLVSFTLNIPGSIKRSAETDAIFGIGMSALETLFHGSILQSQCRFLSTGNEAFLLLSIESDTAKKMAVDLEEGHALGRLFDIDVISNDGNAISRQALGLPPRKCLICGNNAKYCARSSTHSLSELHEKIEEIVCAYFANTLSQRCATCVESALLAELSATPKPGLVDQNNNGSHPDMSYKVFETSCHALKGFFAAFFVLGWDTAEESISYLFPLLREEGLRAEEAMFCATDGVNTHKGAIFSFSILCSCVGRLYRQHWTPPTLEQLSAVCAELASFALRDFTQSTELTHGIQCYRKHHLTGIRGQAASGFQVVMKMSFPALMERLSSGWSVNEASLYTLIFLISTTDDTNMIHRGGLALAKEKRAAAASLLPVLTKENIVFVLSQMDEDYIKNHLSPGGCADLLALSHGLRFFAEEGLITYQKKGGES